MSDTTKIEWADFMQLIYKTQNLDWLILTKRPEDIRDCLISASTEMLSLVGEKNDKYSDGEYSMVKNWLLGSPPENIWLGVSCENQEMADKRVPKLLEIPAKVHFISAEPLLGPIDFKYAAFNGADSLSSMTGIDWIIVGGESGPHARPCNVEWIRSIVGQCRISECPVFVKQLGAKPFEEDECADWPEGTKIIGHDTCIQICLNDKKGGNMDEWPNDLQIRQFPNLKSV